MKTPKTYTEVVKQGRPTAYSTDLIDKICDEVSNGSNLNVLGQMNGYPSRTTLMRWLVEDDKQYFRDCYARARENRADWRADKIDQILVDLRNGVINHHTARIEIDAIKWQAGKEKPTAYGDRTILAGDKNAPVVTQEVGERDRDVLSHFFKNYGDRITPETDEGEADA